MPPVTVEWNTIRPLNGSRAAGFEELCAQLAHAESSTGSVFERKGVPDAGVECYAVLPDGSEWGWQAKYFDGLGDAQWGQIDASITTALQKHPRLVQYFVCVPLDRSDARIGQRRSAKERWDEHVRKWENWATARGMTVQFVWWGSHELLERLASPQHIGRLRFWFDVRRFDQAWFTDRLNEALQTAGPRYTPEIHVELPIAREFEAFGRTHAFFDNIKARARSIRTKLQSFIYSHGQPKASSVDQTVDSTLLEAGVKELLTELGALETQPAGYLPLHTIGAQVETARTVSGDLGAVLMEREAEYDALPSTGQAESVSHHSNPYTARRYYLRELVGELRHTQEVLAHGDQLANSALMILKGAAGTGKTHLLCDIAEHRLASGRPTLLLMGQRFTSSDAPWIQALQQMDLASLSAEETVGAIEAAAQAARCRALVMIDAVNEGAGRLVWPSHMQAFLAQIEKSPWIAVVLSVRSSYEDLVLPAEVRSRAVHITHHGFAEHEYDATKTFFVHFGLELPSTPLLAPEFRNPLFLKTLCRGLQAQGERRLPRGLHGITAIFDLYLSAINRELASKIDYNPRHKLVGRALTVLAEATVAKGERWLTLQETEDAVNTLLPGRAFERSLYRGLVLEGVLIEDVMRREPDLHEEIVFVAYERLADHLVAKTLLDTHLELGDPKSAFAAGAHLAFLWDKSQYISPGLLEAMCIQIPERTGQELISLAPGVEDQWAIGDAFRQSLIWRSQTAFSDETRKILNKLTRNEDEFDATLDVLLTVATLPQHPLNAQFLDRRLRLYSMPDRDSWWSTYLHRAWNTQGPVDRLVDWASSVKQGDGLEAETIDLCALSLAWMFTTSNRYLRDRATKALVSLLSGRLQAVVRFVERLADVDDPYVAERVYAVAYGVAMRSRSPTDVGALAHCVYSRVFASGQPPAHVLLRDYARGVIERALHLGAQMEILVERIRPPYTSQWPQVPSEEDVKPLLPNWERGSHDSGELEWAHNRIGGSVMSDDFARYVIGTNTPSTHWLSLQLQDPPWQSPNDRLSAFLSTLPAQTRTAWDRYAASDELVKELTPFRWTFSILRESDPEGLEVIGEEGPAAESPDLVNAKKERESAFAALTALLAEKQAHSLDDIMKSLAQRDRAPRFDLRVIQRYILWRVFDLGWTTERFGRFDRFSIGYHGREASKAERIGKKYQWIAYHEITALITDHFQYREQYREDGDQAYLGPWQTRLRDIDPSCTLKATPGGTSWGGHSTAWWAPTEYQNWDDPPAPKGWVMRLDDLPRVEDLLRATAPNGAGTWINGQGSFDWQQQAPPDRESTDVERRELWYQCTGYLIRSEDAEAFMKWAEGVDFWGRWMPDPPESHEMFLGEHGWSPASQYFQQPYYGFSGWVTPREGCPVEVCGITLEYVHSTGFDCSTDEGFRLLLPVTELLKGLGIQWSGEGSEYVDAGGKRVTFDPSALSDGPTAFLVQADALRDYSVREGLAVCWTILGEKRVLGPGFSSVSHPALRMTGAFTWSGDRPSGFIKCILDERGAEDAEPPTQLLRIIQSQG